MVKSPTDTPNSAGRSGSSGRARVWVIDASPQQYARTAISDLRVDVFLLEIINCPQVMSPAC